MRSCVGSQKVASIRTPIAQHSPRVLRLEAIGAVGMILLGSAMHFAFELLGNWTPMALVAAVNESIWEHLKLAFWPGLLWAFVTPLPTNLSRWDVLSAKGISLAATAALIVAVFATYTAILGRNLLVLDIGTFVFAICAGQLISALLLTSGSRLHRLVPILGTVLLALQVVAYSHFTFFPPDHWLFVETQTGLRGIPGR